MFASKHECVLGFAASWMAPGAQMAGERSARARALSLLLCYAASLPPLDVDELISMAQCSSLSHVRPLGRSLGRDQCVERNSGRLRFSACVRGLVVAVAWSEVYLPSLALGPCP